MDCGQRLLGILELGGILLFTTGIAARAAIQSISSKSEFLKNKIIERNILIIGNNVLSTKLVKQFMKRNCKVMFAGPESYDVECIFHKCETSNQEQLKELANKISDTFNGLDILIYAVDYATQKSKEPIEEIVEMVDKYLLEHFHVVTKFAPFLLQRSGRFITIEPQKKINQPFQLTNLAVTALSDSLLHQIVISHRQHLHENDGIKTTRVIRRKRRLQDQENIEDSVMAIINGVEAGKTSITLPSAKQHIINILRHITNEVYQLWNHSLREQKIP